MAIDCVLTIQSLQKRCKHCAEMYVSFNSLAHSGHWKCHRSALSDLHISLRSTSVLEFSSIILDRFLICVYLSWQCEYHNDFDCMNTERKSIYCFSGCKKLYRLHSHWIHPPSLVCTFPFFTYHVIENTIRTQTPLRRNVYSTSRAFIFTPPQTFLDTFTTKPMAAIGIYLCIFDCAEANWTLQMSLDSLELFDYYSFRKTWWHWAFGMWSVDWGLWKNLLWMCVQEEEDKQDSSSKIWIFMYCRTGEYFAGRYSIYCSTVPGYLLVPHVRTVH